MGADERAQPVSLQPEMATLNCGSLNFGDGIFENPFSLMCRMAALIREAGVTPELELYEFGHLDNALLLEKEGLLQRPASMQQLVVGVRGGMVPRRRRASSCSSPNCRPDRPGASPGSDAHQLPMARLALTLGGNARVGLEDNIYLRKGVLAQGSWELCAEARKIAVETSRALATPEEARRLLGLNPPKN